MKSLAWKIIIALVALNAVACTSNPINYMTATGKRPPLFFKFSGAETMNKFVFDTKLFSFKPPLAKPIDFTLGKGWHGMTYRDGHGISLGSMVGDIDISTDYHPSKEDAKRALALMNGTYRFDKPHTRMYYGRQETGFIDEHLEYHGKEHYPCLVSSNKTLSKKYGDTYGIGYLCYKLNPSKTKAQEVVISLKYNKPVDPKLAKIYTYKDLKQRAKRMLDSLYIKSWW